MKLHRIPSRGQRWQHYKGNDYLIVGVTEPNETVSIWQVLLDLPQYTVREEATLAELKVFRAGSSLVLIDPVTRTLYKDRYVLYTSTDYGASTIWARRYNNFLENVEVETQLVPRFTRRT